MTATMRIDNRPARSRSRREALAADVHWFGASLPLAFFGQLLFDQVAYREIAASVDRTGRFAENFTDRSVRSFAFGALMLHTDAQDAQRFRELVKTLHRDVHGVGKGEFADTRYSAFDPELWMWIAISTINSVYQAYIRVCGRPLDAADREIVYQTLRSEMTFLELPSRQGKLPATLDDMLAEYDRVAATKLADNSFLQYARRTIWRLPFPTLVVPVALPAPLQPAWRLLAALAARPVVICSTAAAHPRMRELLGQPWGPRHRAEYLVYRTALRTAWRRLPRRLMLEPLAYNRYEYERLRDSYQSLLLESFAPQDQSAT
ncbi:DUF2236 domain-containing protein [Nocardia sp. NEAU-G5]|uniref:DUF2236 domain-containing protein n=1 Tax=Nocardia albiluteola TaxID=2842303 RepID=A0ABS6AYY1_9NOCA|nr:oxygenase MpaB family protein [Nocardia albiluteola]MBU3063244.1 DUF2236 domain-containing protein [Nocardia albiluteola]